MKKKQSKIAYYLELNLGGSSGAAERFTPRRLRPDTELETLRVIKRAAADKKIRGVFVNTSGFAADRGCLWELRGALAECRAAGKKITAYFENGDLDLYWFLSRADKIIMDECGMLTLTGYSWGRFYAKESLEKLGVGFRELRYLHYKSANELFTKTAVSEADREQYGAYLDEVFSLTKAEILEGRPAAGETFDSLLKDGIVFSPMEAKNRNLVDALGREESVREAIQGMEFPDSGEGTVVFVPAGNPACSFFYPNLKAARYRPAKGGRFRPPEIAVVHAKGTTDLDRGMGARNIAGLIRELSEKPRVKALVIRVDSPGGSAVAADFVAAAIKQAKQHVPVVVSMGQAAASGGYWAAMYANHIAALPGTLTGSIGVIGGWFFDKGLGAKLGLGFDSLTRGEHADLGSGILLPKRDLSEDEEARFRRALLDLYGEFVKKAAEGRNMKPEDMELLAQGRVYSGLQARQLGLVDSIGGYLAALETARNLAKIPAGKKIRVNEYPKPKFFENMVARFFSAGLAGNILPDFGAALFSGFARAGGGPDALRFRLANNGRALAILPLTME